MTSRSLPLLLLSLIASKALRKGQVKGVDHTYNSRLTDCIRNLNAYSKPDIDIEF